MKVLLALKLIIIAFCIFMIYVGYLMMAPALAQEEPVPTVKTEEQLANANLVVDNNSRVEFINVEFLSAVSCQPFYSNAGEIVEQQPRLGSSCQEREFYLEVNNHHGWVLISTESYNQESTVEIQATAMRSLTYPRPEVVNELVQTKNSHTLAGFLIGIITVSMFGILIVVIMKISYLEPES